MTGKVERIMKRYHDEGRHAAIQLLLVPSFRREMENLPCEIREDLEGEVLSTLARRRKKKSRRREKTYSQRAELVNALVGRIRAGQDVSKRLYYAHPHVRKAVIEQVPEHREAVESALEGQHRLASLNGEVPYRYANDPHPVVEVLHDAVFSVFKNDPNAASAALERGAKVVIAGGDENAVSRAAWIESHQSDSHQSDSLRLVDTVTPP